MSFDIFWDSLQSHLEVGSHIKNWTAANKYIGDNFKVIAISSNCVEIEAPRAKTIQKIRKVDFEIMFNNWDGYCSRKIQRQEIREQTRVSKYSMSIIKHLKSM